MAQKDGRDENVAGLILAVALFCCCYIWLYDKAAPVYLVEVKVLHRSPLVSAKTKVFSGCFA